MSSIIRIIFFLIGIHFSSCRQQDREAKEKINKTDSLEPVTSDATMINSEALDELPTTTQDIEVKGRIAETEVVPKSMGGIVASKRSMSFGNEYLFGVEKGFYNHTIPKIFEKDLAGIDLTAIRASARPMKSPNSDIKISDPVAAYARVLDLGISMVATTRCVGIFESEDSYYIFYGSDGKPISSFSDVFFVNKNNGQVSAR